MLGQVNSNTEGEYSKNKQKYTQVLYKMHSSSKSSNKQ